MEGGWRSRNDVLSRRKHNDPIRYANLLKCKARKLSSAAATNREPEASRVLEVYRDPRNGRRNNRRRGTNELGAINVIFTEVYGGREVQKREREALLHKIWSAGRRDTQRSTNYLRKNVGRPSRSKHAVLQRRAILEATLLITG